MTNPAYVQWVVMTKGREEKLVHPGNVENHEHAGWVRRYPAEAEVPVDDKAYQTLTVPELTEKVVEHSQQEADAKAREKKAKAEAKAAAKKAKAEAKAAEKKKE